MMEEFDEAWCEYECDDECDRTGTEDEEEIFGHEGEDLGCRI